jgi:hypothetical protein
MPFLFGNFDVFKKDLVKNVQYPYSMMGNFFFPPPLGKGALFNIQKCPWKLVPPPIF